MPVPSAEGSPVVGSLRGAGALANGAVVALAATGVLDATGVRSQLNALHASKRAFARRSTLRVMG
jgi:hypothetical protein